MTGDLLLFELATDGVFLLCFELFDLCLEFDLFGVLLLTLLDPAESTDLLRV